MVKRALRNRCATNADWQVSEVNIVLKCSNRFPIPKTRLLDGDEESSDLLEHFRSLFTSLLDCKLLYTAKKLSKEQLQNTWPS